MYGLFDSKGTLKNIQTAVLKVRGSMRENLPVTQREVKMPAAGRLITTTNPRGVITYCNDEFAEISGFSREELVGQPHNIIRHPDMPSAVFEGMSTEGHPPISKSLTRLMAII